MPSVLVKKNPYMVSQNYFAFELTKKKFTGYGLCKIQTPDVKNYAGSVGAIGAAFQISQRSFIYSDIDVSDFERNIVSRVGFNAIRRTQSNSFHIFNVRCEYQTNKRYETKRKNNFSVSGFYTVRIPIGNPKITLDAVSLTLGGEYTQKIEELNITPRFYCQFGIVSEMGTEVMVYAGGRRDYVSSEFVPYVGVGIKVPFINYKLNGCDSAGGIQFRYIKIRRR
jgi:hypothetical protein